MLYREDRCQLVDVKRIELDEVISFTNSKLVTKSKFCRSSVAQIAHFKVKTNGKFWFSWHAMVFICFVFLLFFFFCSSNQKLDDGKEFLCVNVHLFWNPTVTDVKSNRF